MSERWNASIAGELVRIRPIRISDVAMESAFIKRLSPESKHFRFLGGVRELSIADVVSLCDVDGKRSMALIATVRRGGGEVEIGVARYSPSSHSDVREIAVTVADEWQRRGLGTWLMKQLIAVAKSNGVRQLYSAGLMDNFAMSALVKELGMTSTTDPSDPRQVIHSLTL